MVWSTTRIFVTSREAAHVVWYSNLEFDRRWILTPEAQTWRHQWIVSVHVADQQEEDGSEDERIGESGEEDGRRESQCIERDVERDENGIRRGGMGAGWRSHSGIDDARLFGSRD